MHAVMEGVLSNQSVDRFRMKEELIDGIERARAGQSRPAPVNRCAGKMLGKANEKRWLE